MRNVDILKQFSADIIGLTAASGLAFISAKGSSSQTRLS